MPVLPPPEERYTSVLAMLPGQSFWMCNTCFVLVGDKKGHNIWHRSLPDYTIPPKE